MNERKRERKRKVREKDTVVNLERKRIDRGKSQRSPDLPQMNRKKIWAINGRFRSCAEDPERKNRIKSRRFDSRNKFRPSANLPVHLFNVPGSHCKLRRCGIFMQQKWQQFPLFMSYFS